MEAPRPARVFWPPDRTRDRRPVGGDDIFALGALLYFMLTGNKPPRVDPEAGQVVTPPSWKLKDSELAAYLDPVVLKAMAPRPRDRYLSAHALSDALQALAEVFGLSPAAREVLGLEGRDTPSGAFRREPTSPYLLHDLMGLPTEDGSSVVELSDFDPEDD
jgi:serine/threonine protein kinase